MVKERYNPIDNQWQSWDDFKPEDVANAVYQQVGARFPIEWDPDGRPIVDWSDLPAGVKENDVKQAIRDNHPRA